MSDTAAFHPELVAALRGAQHIAVLTGAGVSAESGIPTFREAQTGLWARYSPEDLATPAAFRRNPKLVWEWYAWRRDLVRRAAPNPAHRALAALEGLAPRVTLITQNVDGLHARAGSTDPIELHGSLERVRCSADCAVFDSWDESGAAPPPCPRCGAPLRPDVVWFGELLPREQLSRAAAAALDCDLFLSVGTSGLVEPAASLPRLALDHGASVAVLNLDVETSGAPPFFTLHGRAGELLPALLRAAWPDRAPAP